MKLIALLMLITLTSCYRMPSEDEYTVVPTINNPAVTRERQEANPLSGIGY